MARETMSDQTALERTSRCDLCENDAEAGAPVYRADGVRLGRIDRTMIDRATGKVVFAVMICESDACLRGERYPLPWSLLAKRKGRGGYEAGITKQELKGAPKLCSTESWDWGSRERGQLLHDYYNVPPYRGM